MKLVQVKQAQYVVYDNRGKVVIITHHHGIAKAWLEKGKRDGKDTGLEDHAASYDAGNDGDVYTLYRMGVKPARFINATSWPNICCHRSHERSFRHLAGI